MYAIYEKLIIDVTSGLIFLPCKYGFITNQKEESPMLSVLTWHLVSVISRLNLLRNLVYPGIFYEYFHGNPSDDLPRLYEF